MGLKIVTIGGGSSYTPELVEGFIKRQDVLPVTELWLVDIKDGEKKLKIVADLARRMVKKAGANIAIHETLNRQEALEGADFVTTQLRVGLLEAREKDERIPLSHGMLGQETNGAGGLFKGLRTIPVILDIVEDVKKYCPNAFVINFTNPAGMVTEAVLKYSGFKKFIGLCNLPVGMERNIANILDVDPSRIRITFAGLNHMVFGIQVFLDGNDITQETVMFLTEPEKVSNLTVKNINPSEFDKDFIQALGVLPCSYHNYYFKKEIMLKNELEEYKHGNIRSMKVKKIEDELFEIYKDQNLDVKPKQLEQRGGAYYSEAACRLIESIYTDKKDIQAVNTQNKGSIQGIDYDSAIEVSSIITKDGAIPLTIGKLPTAAHGLVMQMKAFEQIACEAAVEGNYQKAMLALTINPLTPSDTVAKIVLDELLEAHKQYLPRFFNK